MEISDDEFKEPEFSGEPAWMRLDRATTCRKQLLAAGYLPLPVNGKAPPIAGWQDIEATDQIIRKWEADYTEAINTGILTRTTPAIDIDITQLDAADAVEQLVREHFGERGDPILVRFGKAPKRAVLLRTDEPFNKIARRFTPPNGGEQKIEILGNGQQVVCFGTHPETQQPYSWHGGEPGKIKREDLPYAREGDIVAFLDAASKLLINDFNFQIKDDTKQKKTNGANGAEQPRSDDPAGIRERTYAEAALEGCAAELAAVAPGGRNELLNKLAFRLGRMVARGWIKRADVEAALIEAMTTNGYVAEEGIARVEATLKSGLDAGEKEPHPDLADQEDDEWTEADANQKGPVGLGEWDAGDDIEKPSPRGWLLGNIFARCFISSLIAEGGTGKTALRYAQLLSLATGISITGDRVFQRCRVLIVSLEDDAHELRRRVLAARLHYKIDLSELKGWLFLSAPNAAVGKLMTLDKKGRTLRGALADVLEAAIVARNVDIISLDPFVKTHSVEENSNSAIDDVMQVLADLSAKYNIAVDIPHHTAKGMADPGNAGRGRGASAMKDGGRLIYTLATMTPEEAEAFGVAEEERRLFVRMDSAKVNIAPPMMRAQWFRLVGIPLDNATELYPSGDTVQTVEPWTPPELWKDLSVALLNRILTAIDAGLPDGSRYTDTPNAKERAAWRAVVEHAPEKTEAQAREVIKTWVKNRVLVHHTYDNPVTRKPATGLRVDPQKRPS